ncbi:conserved hypothetical protein [Ricinus communis]|uniref:Uncharacterized protein n=1 Tax=Ricinus communis TaxID=3988 RepID=B9S731_RICCO|nr:conserved hypothetical protein [Ricinus communis]
MDPEAAEPFAFFIIAKVITVTPLSLTAPPPLFHRHPSILKFTVTTAGTIKSMASQPSPCLHHHLFSVTISTAYIKLVKPMASIKSLSTTTSIFLIKTHNLCLTSSIQPKTKKEHCYFDE